MHAQVSAGTVGYAAPEQMQFRNGSPKSDIYSLGATILYFATGETPYDDVNDREYILNQFTMGNPMPVSDSVEVCTSPPWKRDRYCILVCFL
jgi:serine/threonine protein kinase